MKRSKNTISAKVVMKPHSEAKVQFYQKYLEKHLKIMSYAEFAHEIHIYDLFCGRGIYEDGKKGSPIRAYETICKVRRVCPLNKPIVLHLNDRNKKCIETVRNYIQSHYNEKAKPCDIVYTNKDASELLTDMTRHTSYGRWNDGVVNVFFIDPYGYKVIRREFLEKLLRLGSGEILLFLPVSFMQRFTRHAFSDDATPGTLPLKNFLTSYFPSDHPMCMGNTIDIQQYIDYLTEAFSCGGRFYTTSYPIERNSHNLFALFFFSTNLFGYEMVLEQKWKMIDEWGFGFHQQDGQTDMFREEFKNERIKEMLELLRVRLIDRIAHGCSNEEIYNLTIKSGFIPTQAKDILRQIQDKGHLQVYDSDLGKLDKKRNRFFIGYRAIKEHKYWFNLV